MNGTGVANLQHDHFAQTCERISKRCGVDVRVERAALNREMDRQLRERVFSPILMDAEHIQRRPVEVVRADLRSELSTAFEACLSYARTGADDAPPVFLFRPDMGVGKTTMAVELLVEQLVSGVERVAFYTANHALLAETRWRILRALAKRLKANAGADQWRGSASHQQWRELGQEVVHVRSLTRKDACNDKPRRELRSTLNRLAVGSKDLQLCDDCPLFESCAARKAMEVARTARLVLAPVQYLLSAGTLQPSVFDLIVVDEDLLTPLMQTSSHRLNQLCAPPLSSALRRFDKREPDLWWTVREGRAAFQRIATGAGSGQLSVERLREALSSVRSSQFPEDGDLLQDWRAAEARLRQELLKEVQFTAERTLVLPRELVAAAERSRAWSEVFEVIGLAGGDEAGSVQGGMRVSEKGGQLFLELSQLNVRLHSLDRPVICLDATGHAELYELALGRNLKLIDGRAELSDDVWVVAAPDIEFSKSFLLPEGWSSADECALIENAKRGEPAARPAASSNIRRLALFDSLLSALFQRPTLICQKTPRYLLQAAERLGDATAALRFDLQIAQAD